MEYEVCERPDEIYFSTRHVGEHAMSILQNSGFDLIVNPEDSAPSRGWLLEKLRDPEVVAACIMHSQPSDKVDAEFLEACNPGLKCVSTFSVGYGKSRLLGADI
jgi:glyoxylate/hydroxypyruvate reductase